MHLTMLSTEIVCCIYLIILLTYLSVHANSVYTDQTAPVLQEQPDLGLHCLTKRFLKHISRRQKQTYVVMAL